MHVLLINPYVEQMHRELSYAENFRPPLGLAYCAAVLERAGHRVEIVDALVLGLGDRKLEALLRQRRPQLVGLSTYSPTRYECFRTAALVKRVLGPDVPVVTGGPHVSALPDDTLEQVPAIDWCVRGEGEETLLELVQTLEAGGDPWAVPGVSGRRDGQVVHAPDRPNIADLDALPLPARHLLPMRRYGTRMPSTMGACTTVLTSRGCPARCTFCTRDWFSRETRFRSPAAMVDEVLHIQREYGIPGIIFQDDTFTLNKRRILGFCEEVQRRGLRFDWLATTRVDCIKPELLRAMKDAGCKVLTFGAESMNPETLRWLKKGFNVEQVRQAVAWAREIGLTVRCSYLIGVGDETKEDVQRSVRLARELEVSRLKANVGLSVYPGTPLYESALEAGVLPEGYSYAAGWEDTDKRYGNGETPRWYTPHVPRERLLQLRKETEVNILFTRPSLATLTHRARKFARRFRRHPAETLRHVAQFAGSLVSNSGLLGRRPAVADPVAPDDRPRVGA